MTDRNLDQIHRFVLDGCNIRGEIITLSKTYQQATGHQNLPLEQQALLGEFLVAAGLLAETLKFEGVLTVQARGDGPVPLIMAEATDGHTLRGIAKKKDNAALATVDLAGARLADAVGTGILTLTIDPDQGQRYQGIVALESASLADCLSAYFAQSEQLPTRLWLFANDECAAGLLLQALPATADHPSQSDSWTTAEMLAATVTADELLSLPHSEVLGRLFHEFEVRLFEPRPLAFACSCSAERSLNALTALGRADAFALLAEQQLIEVNCEFCGSQYQFGQSDLQALFGADGPVH